MAKLNAGLFIASGTEHAGAPLKISHQRCFKLRMSQKVSRVTPGVTSEKAGEGLIQDQGSREGLIKGSICFELTLARCHRILHL